MAKLQLETKPKSPKNWGMYLYCVKVIKKVSTAEEMTVRADGCSIEANGALVFYKRDGEDFITTLALGHGEWLYVFLAEEQGQYPAAVERWKDVAGIRVVEIEKPVIKVIEKDIVTEKTIEKEVPVSPEDVTDQEPESEGVDQPSEQEQVEESA